MKMQIGREPRVVSKDLICQGGDAFINIDSLFNVQRRSIRSKLFSHLYSSSLHPFHSSTPRLPLSLFQYPSYSPSSSSPIHSNLHCVSILYSITLTSFLSLHLPSLSLSPSLPLSSSLFLALWRFVSQIHHFHRQQNTVRTNGKLNMRQNIV